MATDLLPPPLRTKRKSGVWTAGGSALALIWIGITFDGFPAAGSELVRFMSLNSERPDTLGDLMPGIFGFLAAMTVLALAFVMTMGVLVDRICGKAHETQSLFNPGKRLPLFATIMLTLIAEELFARLLFLGLLGQLWQGRLATYVLFLAGNALWALVHLTNYKNREDRSPLRVLPQFVAGIFFTVVFLEHGFLAALLVHLAYDMVLFSTDKRNKFNIGEWGSLAVNVIVLVVSLIFLDKPLADLSHWVQFNGSFAIPGWSFWNYVWAVLAIGAILSILGEVLMFDSEPVKELAKLHIRALAAVILVVMLVIGYWFIGLFTSNTLDRLLIVAILLLFMHMSGSGSNLAKAFWVTIPSSMLLMCGVFAVDGFWTKVAFVLVLMVINIPEEAFRSVDT